MIRMCAYVYVRKTNYEGREIGGIVIKGKTRLHIPERRSFEKGLSPSWTETHSSV